MEHDPNIEGFFQVDPISPKKVDSVQPPRPGIREQYDLLGFFMNAGEYKKIGPEVFLDIPRERLFAEKVVAFDNNIDRLQLGRQVNQDPDLAQTLAIMTTHLLQEGISELKTFQAEGDIDQELLRKQMVLRQSGDANGAMGLVMNRGLVEELTEHNFPALIAMKPVSRYLLLRDVVSNRIKILEDQLGSPPPETFNQSKSEQNSPQKINREDIEHWKKVRDELIKRYAKASKQSDWQIPEFE